jgi:CNT family concentrative nucleoside transporter
MCGFANFGSVGIQIGGYAGLAPGRRADLSELALRAMFGGLLATSMVACVAGVLL